MRITDALHRLIHPLNIDQHHNGLIVVIFEVEVVADELGWSELHAVGDVDVLDDEDAVAVRDDGEF